MAQPAHWARSPASQGEPLLRPNGRRVTQAAGTAYPGLRSHTRTLPRGVVGMQQYVSAAGPTNQGPSCKILDTQEKNRIDQPGHGNFFVGRGNTKTIMMVHPDQPIHRGTPDWAAGGA